MASDGPNPDGAEETRTFEAGVAGPGGEIGPYRLVRQLGEGGMGVVYQAAQTHPIRRSAALKIIKPGMDTRQVIARFEGERQALAVMDHPNIARVFDAGTTAAGLPFFAMELVDGTPLTRYCDEKRLTVNERIALFIPVGKAIQHAHQKGVIHRDIKPSNILVAEHDGKPVPKVIDFGLAKALAWQLDDATMLTNMGTVLGTLDYMSPEQADPARHDVDTRSDVYSLGAVLYELLTGTTPLDRARLEKAGFVEALRHVRDQETPPPSSRLRQSASSVDIAGMRQSDPVRLRKLLHGELDWILMKALEKDRGRRYETVSGMVRDLERYLAGEPVEAAPPSAAYRASKFLRRHVIAFSFAGTVLVLLMAFAVAVAVEARRIARERDRANRVTQFMVGIFKVADPQNNRGNTITAREILDKSAKEIDAGLGSEPQVKGDLLAAMADSYDGLGLYSQARDLTAKVLDIQRRTFGPNDRRTLATMSFLGSTMVSSGASLPAVKWLADTLALQEKALGADDRDALQTRRYLSDAYFAESDFTSTERVARETVTIARRVLGPENADTLQAMSRLGDALELQGHFPEAEKLQRDVLEIDQRVRGPEDAATLSASNELAKVLVEEERFAEAETILGQVLPVERRIFGDAHPHTLEALGNLGYAYMKEGRYPEAEKAFREIVDSRIRVYGPDNMLMVSEMEELAIIYAREGRYDDASRLFQQAIGIAEKRNDPVVKVGWYNFACAAALAGHREDALRYLRAAVDKGFLYPDAIEGDKDLASLRGDPRFTAILDDARKGAANEKK